MNRYLLYFSLFLIPVFVFGFASDFFTVVPPFRVQENVMSLRYGTCLDIVDGVLINSCGSGSLASTTDDLPEGVLNLYYDDDRVASYINASTTLPHSLLSKSGESYLSVSGMAITASDVSLTSNVTGTLALGNGGTGTTSLTGLLQGNGTSAITGVTGTVGQIPYYNGTNTLLATSTMVFGTDGWITMTGHPTHVLNQNASTFLNITNTNSGSGAEAAVQFVSDGGYSGVFGMRSSTNTGGIFGGNGGYLYSNGPGGLAFVNNNATGAVKFAAGGITEQMRIDPNGEVGIGDTTPDALLDVGGEMRADGVSGDGSGKVMCIKSNGDFGTCSSVVGVSGTCTCG